MTENCCVIQHTIRVNKSSRLRIIVANAAQVIIAHNHPHGRAMPSRADLETTNLIRQSLKSIHVELIDHIVLGEEGYYSFAKNRGLK
ncbi:MAG: JAB domain-containing protein [Butyricicoccaceae bacterium]